MEGGVRREAMQPATAEEEALKRSTDCVYFLASPLTCKKIWSPDHCWPSWDQATRFSRWLSQDYGLTTSTVDSATQLLDLTTIVASPSWGSECDYRHSEGARVNPRDCWYWLNGNCLNPKCSFRHPPLDSLFATAMPNSGSPPLSSQTSASTLAPAARTPNNGTKQSVPCYYFQWGQCLKGEKCAFMHGPQASVNFLPQPATKVSSLSSAPRKSNDQDTHKIITMQHNTEAANHDRHKMAISRHSEISYATVKHETKAYNAPKHEPSENKILPPHSIDGDHRGLPQNGVSVNSDSFEHQPWGHQVQPTEEEPDNGRDGDEFFREHSPGFDVLVEDDIEDPDYYHNEDNFRRMSGHGGQKMEAEDEYDYHPSDYMAMTKIERDLHNGIGKYENYELPHSRYGWESKNAGRTFDRASSLERREIIRKTKCDAMNGSDLRYQLNKRRRFNGTRSTSNHGHSEHYQTDEQHAEERHYVHHSHDDDLKFPPEKCISSRLQGRIAFPGRSVIDAASNMLSEKERGQGPRSRWSPMKRINYQSRHSERVRYQPSEIFCNDERFRRIKTTLKDDTDSVDFVSPKSLAELKGARKHENIEEIKGAGSNSLLGVQNPENPISFEGPLPLSAILKRKRESAYAKNEVSTAQHENSQNGDSSIHESVPQLEARTEGKTIIGHEEDVIPADNELAYDSHYPTKANALGTEDGLCLENAEEEELENSDKQDGDFNYESGKDKEDDDSNKDDLDDDDDFARKVSAMLS
ncbi:hypothetical protein ZIOFF_061986 [Zingiber officinale]|uniref:C3H1-type domain-containing protein n=2 Tax=Zingiber officinale TaxID=94328 RepID=A0A8J5KIU7_ZINOF|nr:hypothetical protein ZIOFF_061986 [Zingiber officinale]